MNAAMINTNTFVASFVVSLVDSTKLATMFATKVRTSVDLSTAGRRPYPIFSRETRDKSVPSVFSVAQYTVCKPTAADDLCLFEQNSE